MPTEAKNPPSKNTTVPVKMGRDGIALRIMEASRNAQKRSSTRCHVAHDINRKSGHSNLFLRGPALAREVQLMLSLAIRGWDLNVVSSSAREFSRLPDGIGMSSAGSARC